MLIFFWSFFEVFLKFLFCITQIIWRNKIPFWKKTSIAALSYFLYFNSKARLCFVSLYYDRGFFAFVCQQHYSYYYRLCLLIEYYFNNLNSIYIHTIWKTKQNLQQSINQSINKEEEGYSLFRFFVFRVIIRKERKK